LCFNLVIEAVRKLRRGENDQGAYLARGTFDHDVLQGFRTASSIALRLRDVRFGVVVRTGLVTGAGDEIQAPVTRYERAVMSSAHR